MKEPLRMPLVNKTCETCSAVILTRSGTLRWCSACRAVKYPESQEQAKRRAIRRKRSAEQFEKFLSSRVSQTPEDLVIHRGIDRKKGVLLDLDSR